MRDYIVQVARFDPSKGLPHAIRSYVKARHMLDDKIPGSKHPQLCLVGHGAVDDPDATIIYDQIMDLLQEDEISPFANDIVVLRLPASDQCNFLHIRANCSAQCDHVQCQTCLTIVFARGIRD